MRVGGVQPSLVEASRIWELLCNVGRLSPHEGTVIETVHKFLDDVGSKGRIGIYPSLDEAAELMTAWT